MRIRKLLRVRFVVDPFTEQEKIMAELTPMMQKYMETKEQYKVLEGMQVRMIQGYYFDRPMPRDRFESKYVHQKEQEQSNF